MTSLSIDRRVDATRKRAAAGPTLVTAAGRPQVRPEGDDRAGGAYARLDPMYPPERLAFLISDSLMHAVVTDGALAAALPGGSVPALVLGRADGEGDGRSALAPPRCALDPGRLSYVIYTSGSTGRPKGVQIEHRSVLHVIRTAIRDFGLGPESRVLQLASISFDASVLEVFMTLGSGGTLFLVDQE